MFISPQEVITSYLKLEPGEKKTCMSSPSPFSPFLPYSYISSQSSIRVVLKQSAYLPHMLGNL